MLGIKTKRKKMEDEIRDLKREKRFSDSVKENLSSTNRNLSNMLKDRNQLIYSVINTLLDENDCGYVRINGELKCVRVASVESEIKLEHKETTLTCEVI